MASESEHVVRVRAEWDNAVMVRPGDTLVIGMSDAYGGDFEQLRSDIAEHLPGVRTVIMEGATAFAACRPDDDPLAALRAPIPDWERQLLEQQAERDALYRERAQLVAYLAACWPSEIRDAPDAPGWMIIYIRTPKGQMSWHLSFADAADLFSHVPVGAETEWDGHTTEQKYDRLADLTCTVATGVFGPLPGGQ